MSISKGTCRLQPGDQGFTLIELLVVITLMGSLLALVGPLSVESVERMAAQRELRGLQALLKASSARAFTHGEVVTLALEGRTLRASQGQGAWGAPLEEKRYEHLAFHPATLSFSRGGFPSSNTLRLTYRDQERSLDLSRLLSGQAQDRRGATE